MVIFVHKKLVAGHQEHVRFNMKQAVYSLIISNNYPKAMKKLDEAY